MKEPNDDMPSNAMRSDNEAQRPPEVKVVRDELVLAIRGVLDDATQRQADGRPLGPHGQIMDGQGIIRTTIGLPEGADRHPSSGLAIEETRAKGAYLYLDQDSGQRSLVVVEANRVTEISDNTIEQYLAGPEAGYSGLSPTVIASFKEWHTTDGSYVGSCVTASGGFYANKYDGDYHTGASLMSRPSQADMMKSFWADVQTAVYGE